MLKIKKEFVAIPSLVLDEALQRLQRFPEGIKLIREKEGLSYGRLAQSLNISKTEVWNWEHGKRMPKESLTLLCLLIWADKLRSGLK